MRLHTTFLRLPVSILFLIGAYSNTAYAENKKAAAFPFDLLSKLQLHQASVNRDIDVANRAGKMPPGVLKMSDDEGEKFYMEYWQFGGNLPQTQAPMLSMRSSPALRRRDLSEEKLPLANATTISYRPAFALHREQDFYSPNLEARGQVSAKALAVLQNRQFSCPTGTSSCSGIGYPNSCCATDETCFQITDTGLGPVGCCPSVSSCGGMITTCDAPNTACPDNNGGSYTGGGCCIPNYVCAGVGCKPPKDVLLNLDANIWQVS